MQHSDVQRGIEPVYHFLVLWGSDFCRPLEAGHTRERLAGLSSKPVVMAGFLKKGKSLLIPRAA
jgi:hypothetical protein